MNNKSCAPCALTKKIIQEWLDKQGHDRCWYYPDLFMKLAVIKLYLREAYENSLS